MTDTPDRSRRTWTTGRPFTIVVLTMILGLAGLGYWSTQARISGAVIGKGALEVSTTMTAVQHPVGGVVDQIFARNGDRVHAGDLLVRLDSSQPRSDLTVTEGELFETLANIARLEAVIDNRERLDLHPLLTEAAAAREDIALLVERQHRQLTAHFEAVTSGMGLLDEQAQQIRAEIAGVTSQLEATRDELTLLAEEIANADILAERNLIKGSDVYKLKKEDVAMRGDIGRLEAKIAELRGKISELTLKRLAVVPVAQEKAEDALSKLRPLRTRYMEKRLQLTDTLSKLEIRAPVDGTIHQSALFGARSVVVAAKPLMMIVPSSEPVQVAVRVDATDIDQVHVGQEASIKFKAFSQRELPIILGDVARISADAISDPVTKSFYYDVKVTLRTPEMAKLGDRDLVPGMPVEAFMSTNSQIAIQYVLRPIKHYFDRAFRDT
ncbi:HlyD family type I secretion periplasmic adaptor subunit [Marinovum sp.]|uniref:HlyD family type I secretion periplasmic adaptor subunit n=1 Tax=Marinovum sp. TaxID=2024839 RepID=UPI002B265612|nr:HlyD family type I secretion periplasmic adaptor subunit [Marinovum sp.]